VNRSFFLSFAAFGMRSSACDTLSRSCARRLRCWLAFPSAFALGSIGSAVGCPTLFGNFTATMAESDFSRVHHRLRLLAFRMRASGGPFRIANGVATRSAPLPYQNNILRPNAMSDDKT